YRIPVKHPEGRPAISRSRGLGHGKEQTIAGPVYGHVLPGQRVRIGRGVEYPVFRGFGEIRARASLCGKLPGKADGGDARQQGAAAFCDHVAPLVVWEAGSKSMAPIMPILRNWW